MIESIHIIYKHLLTTGTLDVSVFRDHLISKGFREKTRVIETPAGPLKEYLYLEPSSLQDLIVVSAKGWVVDSRSHRSALNLISLGYDLYEEAMGELASEIVANIVEIITATIILHRSYEDIISSLFSPVAIDVIRKNLNRTDIYPFAATLSMGVPKPPHEWVTISISPAPIPHRKNRINIQINYRSMDPDKGVLFVRNLPDFLENLGKALEKIRRD